MRSALEASGCTAEEDDIVMCAAGSLYSGQLRIRLYTPRNTNRERSSAGTDTVNSQFSSVEFLIDEEPVNQLTGFILNFILLLTRNPDVQARARKEIALVVGPNRLPGLQDRSSLPYVDCVIQEVHRFNPTIPLVTHANSKEDEYLSQAIPEKTWLMANVWYACYAPSEIAELTQAKGDASR